MGTLNLRNGFFTLLVAALSLQAAPTFTEILGRPTDRSVTVNARADTALELYFEYGVAPSTYIAQTQPVVTATNQPVERLMDGLTPNTRYYYRMRYRNAGSSAEFLTGTEHTFHTQRQPGSTFTFAAQGDSHPERANSMFNSDLYIRTMKAVAAEQPDFYLTSGDDFSVDTLTTVNATTVADRYTLQLPYFGLMAHSTPLFLVNGNHEQAARYLLDGTPNNVAVWAQNARNRYYSEPAPDTFYTGNTEQVPNIGLLRDYYAWEWGDALFVTIDPYWSSPVVVDNVFGNNSQNPADNGKTTNRWDITHGDAQYQWLKRTLEQSKAKWKFVFAHHVLGTGRGGVEVADEFEWGGNNANGVYGFAVNRPTWTAPIHQLMAANHVTIFFQGHDHLFVHQQLDGVVYQELPNPADNTYTAFNSDAYKSGDQFPNAGYVKVTVSPSAVKVDYIREFLPKDETPTQVSGMVQFSYTIPATSSATPSISRVATAASDTSTIAPNTWVEIKGSNLAPATSSRIWQTSDFVNNQLPKQLDGVSVTVNGKAAYVYYVSPGQVNILTPPDALTGSVPVQVTVNGVVSTSFTAQAQAVSPSLFVFNGGPYVAARHANGSLLGPVTLFLGSTTPAKPGEIVSLYANGFGTTDTPVVSGSLSQSGTLLTLPVVRIAGAIASVQFAGLVSPGLYQFNVVIPQNTPDGDQPVLATYNTQTTQAGTLLTIQK